MLGRKLSTQWWNPHSKRRNGLSRCEDECRISRWMTLFKFNSKDAEHILQGDWKFGTDKGTNYWSSGDFLSPEPFQNTEYGWYWIRVLGLALHLWSTSIMKEIEDKCCGWLARELRTELHHWWAHIRLKRAQRQIPNWVKIVDREWVFPLPIWVQSPARYRRGGWVRQSTCQQRAKKGPDNLRRNEKVKEMNLWRTKGSRRDLTLILKTKGWFFYDKEPRDEVYGGVR